MKNLDEINQMVGELKGSPIFAMSLGSLELYHSNFWAWIVNQYDQKFGEFFFKDLEGQKFEVLRESRNRDLTIRFDNKDYVI